MKRTTSRIALVTALLTPSVASADINFNVQNLSGKYMCIYCAGPWFRLGESGPIRPLGQGFWTTFYTAETNIFTPVGPWGCGVKEAPNQQIVECNWVGTLPAQKTAFCVPDVPGVQVGLAINADQSLASDQPPQQNGTCNDSTVWSFLGDLPAGQQYEGAYRFTGNAGETITVTLDRDGARGSEGEIAQLTLWHEQGKLEHRLGALPLTFTATLRKSGTYEVAVAYPPDDTPKPFRGYYKLDVIAPDGEPVTLEPVNP